jgi:membrane protease YdiL (CAAX protease family)
MLFAYYAIQICMVGFLEETGWRGWLLRRRLETASPLCATLFVALLWGLWHAPKLLGDWRFAFAFAGAILVNSFLLTICWARLRGGIALAAIAHGSFNAPLYYFSDSFGGQYDLAAFGIAALLNGALVMIFVVLSPGWWTKRSMLTAPATSSATPRSGV